MPLVSICIPTSNFGKLIGTAIQSVLSQDFKDFELIIVDNASIDNTEDVIDSFQDSRIRYFRNPINIGFARNLQKAFELSTGEFLQFLCADDYLCPGYLTKAVAMLKRFPDLAFVHTGHDLVDISGKLLERRIYSWKETVNAEEFLNGCMEREMSGVFLSSVLMRREKLKRVGGVDVGLNLSADYGIWFKLCFEGNVGYIAEPLAIYQIHERQATRNFIPGLKLRLVEYFISNAKKRGMITEKFEKDLLSKELFQASRELLRHRTENASIATLWKNFNALQKKYPEGRHLFPDFFFFLIALLPAFFLKLARQLYLKCVRSPGVTQ